MLKQTSELKQTVMRCSPFLSCCCPIFHYHRYIFPAIGLAAASVKALRITDDDMLVAARTLAAQVTPERLAVGCLYPPLDDIRQVSANIAAAVAANIYSRGDANLSPRPDDLLKHCQSMMWNPKDNQSASKL